MDNSKIAKLKICYILSTTEGGTWAFEQLRDLRNHYGYEVAVVLSGDTGTLVDKFKAEGISVHAADFDFMRPTDLFYLPFKVMKLIQFLRKNRFDIIQTHLFPSMVLGRIASWVADVPIRLSMIAGPFHLEAQTPLWVDKVTSWMDTTIIPSCEYSRQLYLKMGLPRERLKVIYYGPDERFFDADQTPPANLRNELGFSEDTPLIGMVAYFYPKLGTNRWTPPYLHGKAIKGHEDVIRAAPKVLEEFPKAKFLLIGKGWGVQGEEQMRSLQNLVKELELENQVIFIGHRKDVPQIYRALNVSIQASLNENLGGTIEALLMECPTVVTRVGGLVDTVLDGQTGVQVNPADPEDLSRGILSLLRDPDAAKTLGKAGRQRMLEFFTLKSTVKDLDTLFKALHPDHHKGYRTYMSLIRFILGGLFGFFVALRFFFLDIWLIPRWNLVWKPQILILPKVLYYKLYKILKLYRALYLLKNLNYKFYKFLVLTKIVFNKLYRQGPRLFIHEVYRIISRRIIKYRTKNNSSS